MLSTGMKFQNRQNQSTGRVTKASFLDGQGLTAKGEKETSCSVRDAHSCEDLGDTGVRIETRQIAHLRSVCFTASNYVN